jgi:hypothetical protein
MRTKFKIAATLAAGASVLAVGCGKKASDDTIAAKIEEAKSKAKALNVDDSEVTAADEELVIPGALALLPAKESSTALRLTEGTTDLAKHKTFYRTYSRSTEAAEQAGQILCYIEQTQFWKFANKGPYIAMVSESKCKAEEGGSDGQSGGGQSRQDELMKMIVNVTRGEKKPLAADIIVVSERDGDEQKFPARIVVAEGPSTSNPLGIFRMGWDQGERGGGMIETSRNEAGEVQLIFKEIGTDEHEGRKMDRKSLAAVILKIENEAVVGGRMISLSEEPSYDPQSEGKTDTKQFAVVFDDKFMIEKAVGSDAQCMSRTDFTNRAHSYNLYEKSSGKLKTLGELGSGLEIAYEVDGKTRRGHASYWGIHGAEGLDNGAEVKGIKWVEGKRQESDYTLVKAPGKLVKYTAKTLTLGKLKGVDLNYHDNSGGGGNSQYIVKYEGGKFVKKSKVTHSQDGMTEEAASGEVSADWSGRLSFYVSSLQANIDIPSDFSDSTELRYFSGEVVSGDSAQHPSGSLLCFNNCPLMTGHQSGWDGAYHSETVSGQGGGTYKKTASDDLVTPFATYSFDASTLNIKEGSTAFAMASSSGDQNNVWISSGALVSADQLAAISGRESKKGWEIERLISSFYRWEASNNNWGQFQGLKDSSGDFVKFEKPLEFSYTHSTANDINGSDSFDGIPARLNYGGPGQFWGIPSEKSDFGHWVPKFSIANGVEVSDYVVMANNVDQFPNASDAANCAGYDLSAVPELPNNDVPDIETKEFGDANTPTLVIKGEIIE